MKISGTVFLFCLLFASILNSKTLYVSTAGADTNAGTINFPLKRLQKRFHILLFPGIQFMSGAAFIPVVQP